MHYRQSNDCDMQGCDNLVDSVAGTLVLQGRVCGTKVSSDKGKNSENRQRSSYIRNMESLQKKKRNHWNVLGRRYCNRVAC